MKPTLEKLEDRFLLTWAAVTFSISTDAVLDTDQYELSVQAESPDEFTVQYDEQVLQYDSQEDADVVFTAIGTGDTTVVIQYEGDGDIYVGLHTLPTTNPPIIVGDDDPPCDCEDPPVVVEDPIPDVNVDVDVDVVVNTEPDAIVDVDVDVDVTVNDVPIPVVQEPLLVTETSNVTEELVTPIADTTSEVVEDEDPEPVVTPTETVSAPLLVGTPMSKRLFLASTKAPVVPVLEDVLIEELL